jgi:phospholipase/carboxylesterase
MPDQRHAAFVDRLSQLGSAVLTGLDAFEKVRRRLQPPELPSLREAVAPLAANVHAALDAFRATPAPDELSGLAQQLIDVAEMTARTLDDFCAVAAPHEAISKVLGAMHQHCRTQERLYPLHRVLPPVSLFFTEPARRDRMPPPDPEPPLLDPPVGLILARTTDSGRGGFSMYVPEHYAHDRNWPLVVALHGGSGTGADFLWTWLAEARTRGFLLLAPTALGSTWSLDDPEIDGDALRAMIQYVSGRWRVDPTRILLTGLSDGATFALLCGLMPDMPVTALAPVSGVLHPANLVNGNLERARGRRIYLVHGALDWMFPIALARIARDTLQHAGADVVLREIPDLSHTYPREENGRILTWFDPALVLPAADWGSPPDRQ